MGSAIAALLLLLVIIFIVRRLRYGSDRYASHSDGLRYTKGFDLQADEELIKVDRTNNDTNADVEDSFLGLRQRASSSPKPNHVADSIVPSSDDVDDSLIDDDDI